MIVNSQSSSKSHWLGLAFVTLMGCGLTSDVEGGCQGDCDSARATCNDSCGDDDDPCRDECNVAHDLCLDECND